MSIVQEPASPVLLSRGERLAWWVFRRKIHVALLPVFLTAFWQIDFRFPLPPAYYVMIALHTLGGALANLLTDRKEDALNNSSPERTLPAHSVWLRPAILGCYTISLLIALHAGLRVVLFGTLMNALAYLYGVKIPIRKNHGTMEFRIKSVFWLKNAYDSLQWSLALILGLYIFVDRPVDARAVLPIIISFFVAFFVNLVWDIRDMPGDRLAGVVTIPVRFGESKSRLLLHAINLATGSAGMAALIAGIFPKIYWLFGIHVALSAWFVERYMASRDRARASHLYLVSVSCFLGIVVACDYLSRSLNVR